MAQTLTILLGSKSSQDAELQQKAGSAIHFVSFVGKYCEHA